MEVDLLEGLPEAEVTFKNQLIIMRMKGESQSWVEAVVGV